MMGVVKIVLTSKDIQYIHEVEHRVLTLKECDELLEYRRRFGDLHPDNIRREQEEFFKKIEVLK